MQSAPKWLTVAVLTLLIAATNLLAQSPVRSKVGTRQKPVAAAPSSETQIQDLRGLVASQQQQLEVQRQQLDQLKDQMQQLLAATQQANTATQQMRKSVEQAQSAALLAADSAATAWNAHAKSMEQTLQATQKSLKDLEHPTGCISKESP